ncbi:uncharacterized protein LOC143030918 isoform X3 [Oratosquilla oratoria]|uniref:uncharacterized protein LOC143030918 isoform X3 n=1 Tax=Oratosquilla oratoria TaxID=337810 RepID=UPI003F75D15D
MGKCKFRKQNILLTTVLISLEKRSTAKSQSDHIMKPSSPKIRLESRRRHLSLVINKPFKENYTEVTINNTNQNHNLRHSEWKQKQSEMRGNLKTTFSSNNSSSYSLIILVFFFVTTSIEASSSVIVPRSVEYQLVPWEDLVEEIQQMTKGKEDCTPQFTQCSHNGTSRNTTNPNEDTSLNVIRSNCYCDAQSCVRYGDCCSDLARTLWGDGREEGSDRYSCHYLSGTKDIGILMVGLCLHKYKDSQVEKLCLKQVPKEAYTYILDLPMTSSKTRVTYVNYHCAVCNDDANHLHIWNVTINCSTRQILRSMNLSDFMEKAIYQPGMLMWRRFLFRDRTGEKSFSFQQNLTCKLVVLEFADLSTFTQRFGGRVCPFPHKPCIKSAIGTPRCIHQVPSRRERIRLKLYVRLAVLQGLTWVFGFVAALGDVRECWYPFIILNGLQGFFIFLGFDLKRKVLKSVWKALTGQSCMGHLRSTRDTRTTTLSTSDSPQVQTSTAAVTKKTSVSHAERTVGLSRPYTKPSPLQPRHLVQLPSQAPLKPLQHRRHPPPICNPNVHGRHEHSSGAALDSKPQEGERETESRLAAAEKALSSWLEPDKVDDVGESTDIRDGLDVSGSSSDEVPNCGNQRQVGPVSLTAGLRGGDLRAGVVRGHFKDEEASPHLMSSADGITDEDSLAPHPSSTLGLHCQSTQSLPPRASRVTAVPHLDRSRSHQLRRHANHEPLQELDSQTQDMQEHFSHSMPLLPSLLLPSHNPIPNQSRTHLLEMPQQEISPSLPPPPSLPTVPPTLTPTSQMHQELLHVQHRRDPLYFHPEQRRVRLDRMDAFGDASVDNEIYKVWTGSTLPEASFQDSGVRLVESHPHLPVVVDEGKCLAKSKSLSQISQAVLAATILKRSRQRSVPVSDPPPVTLPRTKDNYFDRDKGQEEIKSSRLCTQV